MRITKKEVAQAIQAIDISVNVEELVKDNTMLMLQQMLKDLQAPVESKPTEVWDGPSKMLYDATIKFALKEDGKADFRNPIFDVEKDYLMTYQLKFFGGETATAKFAKIKDADWQVNYMSGRLGWMWKNIKQGSGKTPDVASALKWIQSRGNDGEVVVVEPQSNQKNAN